MIKPPSSVFFFSAGPPDFTIPSQDEAFGGLDKAEEDGLIAACTVGWMLAEKPIFMWLFRLYGKRLRLSIVSFAERTLERFTRRWPGLNTCPALDIRPALNIHPALQQ